MDAYLKTLDRIYNLRGGVIDLRLDRMDRALELFGHPEKTFPSFHVAGTNGKGSTAAMLHRILFHAGYRVGLYTSPHLVSFTERIRVGSEEIRPEEVVELADEIWHRTDAASLPLTFFEIVTVMAFVFFSRSRVDVAVIEVGLGGRLDATNLVRSVVSVITTISRDHEAFLGSDLESIAQEKGGIIKPGIPVVCGTLSTEVAAVLRGIAERLTAPFYQLQQNFILNLKADGTFDYKGAIWHLENVSLALRGRYQRRNAALAIAALETVREQFTVHEAPLRLGLSDVNWPGRMEVMLLQPVVILDGAHNGEGVHALVDELRDLGGTGRIKVLFAAMEDKDWHLMLSDIAEVADEIVLTRVSQMERSADPERLGTAIAGKLRYRIMPDPGEALHFLIDTASPRDTIVVAGSLYLIGEVRPMLHSLAQDKPLEKGRSS